MEKNNGNNYNVERSADQIADEVAAEIRQSVLEFITSIRSGSKSSTGMITIDQLEKHWDILDAKTKELYVKAIGKELSAINEKDLIESKKENSQKRG